MKKRKIIVLCDLCVGGERGRVMSGGGISPAISATEYKDALKVIKRYGEKTANHSFRRIGRI